MSLVQPTLTGPVKKANGSAWGDIELIITPDSIIVGSGQTIPAEPITVPVDSDGNFSVQLYSIEGGFQRYWVKFPNDETYPFDLPGDTDTHVLSALIAAALLEDESNQLIISILRELIAESIEDLEIGASWGEINGTLANQTDLNNALGLRELLANKSTDGTFTANSDSLYPSQKATRTFVLARIAELVESSPETLNTLNEIAAALGDDPNFATTILNLIGTKQTALVSGTNIKTVNNQSILGAGNIEIEGTGGLPPNWYNVEDPAFGAVPIDPSDPDAAPDSTDAIQACILAALADSDSLSPVIYFPGRYRVNKDPSQVINSVQHYMQLYVPLTPYDAGGMAFKTLTFLGASPGSYETQAITDMPTPYNGCGLYSTRIETSDRGACVLGSELLSGGGLFGGLNYTTVFMDNFSIIIKTTDAEDDHITNYMSGIDFNYVSQVNFGKVQCRITSPLDVAAAPPNNNFGLRLPGTSNHLIMNGGLFFAVGFGNGIILGEHADIQMVCVVGCKVGVYNRPTYPTHIGTLAAEINTKTLLVTDNSSIAIDVLQNENDAFSGRYYQHEVSIDHLGFDATTARVVILNQRANIAGGTITTLTTSTRDIDVKILSDGHGVIQTGINVWTTATRPTTLRDGIIGWNAETDKLEIRLNGQWRTIALEAGEDVTAPVMTAFTATETSSTQINVAYAATDNVEVEGFDLEWSATGDSPDAPSGESGWSILLSNSAAVSPYSHTGRTAETQYFYRGRARDTSGNESAWSTANATTEAGGGVYAGDIHDLFSGTASSSLNGRTPDTVSNGNTWEVIAGNFAINQPGGGASYAGGDPGSTSLAVINMGGADVIITAEYISGSGAGIIFRAADVNNFFNCFFSGSDIQIYKCEAGGFSPVGAAAAHSLASGHILEVRTNGNNFEVWVSGVQKITTSSSFNAMATKHGIRSGSSVQFNECEIVEN